jgi:DNA-binding MarR family transcriptional regulator
MFGLARTDHIQEVIEQWTAETPTLDRSAFAVIGRISRLADLLEPELDLVFAEHGLTGGEFDVLAALRRSGPPYRLTPTSLRKALLLSSGGMTKRLAGLENRGLVRRESETGDRRLRAVTLTPHGRHLVDAVLPDHIANEERLLRDLNTSERRDLARLLEKLAVALHDTATRQRLRPPEPPNRQAHRPEREARVAP